MLDQRSGDHQPAFFPRAVSLAVEDAASLDRQLLKPKPRRMTPLVVVVVVVVAVDAVVDAERGLQPVDINN